MNENDLKDLENQFDAAFFVPAKFHWQSRRALFHWIDRELLQDDLAGPIYSIVRNGGCDYVYGREDDYFRGVNNPADSRSQLRQKLSQMVEFIESFAPASSAEAADLDSMRRFASEMESVVETACDIEQRRWESSNAR